MTEADAFHQQAKSDFEVFELLLGFPRDEVAECHPLHYLQMATEKVAKAAFCALGVEGRERFSHVAFSSIRHHLGRRDVARALGYADFRAYLRFLNRSAPVHREFDELNPSVGPQLEGGGPKEGPNVEYPWRGRDERSRWTWHAPATHSFELLDRLQRSGDAAQVLGLVRLLIQRFHAVFPRTQEL